MTTDAERVRAWRRANPEKVRLQKKRHTAKYKERSLARILAWEKANPERAAQAAHRLAVRRYASDPEKHKATVKAIRLKLKLEWIAAYGHKCKCCGEDRHEFLTIDHIKGGGRKHTESLGLHGAAFHAWLRKRGYPQDDYRLLCINCNFAIGHSGYCPHEKEFANRVEDLAC